MEKVEKGKGDCRGSSVRGRVLVTGGAGFVGANLVRLLINRSYKVTVLDNLSTGRREYIEGLPVEFIEGDILDADLVKRVVLDHDGIVHLAAQTGVAGSLADPRRDCELNVIGTLNLLEALGVTADGSRQSAKLTEEVNTHWLGAKTPRFIFASSNAPLGKQPPPATEDRAPLPISPYGASKLAGEAYCLAYHGSWGVGTVVLRLGNVYGPFSYHKNSVVAKLFKDILSRGEVTIEGDGQQTRDFVYVEDLCRAILAALESNVSGEVFQIATGLEAPIGILAEKICRLAQADLGFKVQVRHVAPRVGDMSRNYSSIVLAKQRLGYVPRVPLDKGLRWTWEWFRVHAGVQVPKVGRD